MDNAYATYRNDLLEFYAKSDPDFMGIKEAKDVAGKRVIVGSGNNQEAILAGAGMRRTGRTA